MKSEILRLDSSCRTEYLQMAKQLRYLLLYLDSRNQMKFSDNLDSRRQMKPNEINFMWSNGDEKMTISPIFNYFDFELPNNYYIL